MEYTGKLYGRIGNKHFDTGHTAKDWDELIKQVETLKEQLNKEQKLPVDLVSNTILNTKCTKCNHVFELKYSNGHELHDTLKIGVDRDADVYEVEVECPNCDNIETVY